MNRAVRHHASLTSPTSAGAAWRLACAGYLGAVALCSGLAFVGSCQGDSVCLATAAGLGGVALVLRRVLRSGILPGGETRPEVFENNETGDARSATGAAGDGAALQAEELAELLRAWSACERSRGTKNFDPWAWQSLRAEIRGRLRDEAGLRRLLTGRE